MPQAACPARTSAVFSVRAGTVIRCFFFFFNDTATTEIYTLSLHDALPISIFHPFAHFSRLGRGRVLRTQIEDRKSTRLNSSHANISYAVFCLKKKKRQAAGPHYTLGRRPRGRPPVEQHLGSTTSNPVSRRT